MSGPTPPSAPAPAEPDVSARARRLRRVAAGRMAGLRLVLDRLEDSGNRAAVLRSCEAFGLLHVHEIVGLRPSQQPRVAQKVAAAAKHGGNRRMRRGVGNGGEKWLCVHRHETAAACAEALRGAGFRIVATVPPPEGDRSDSWHDARAAADAAAVGERNEALAQLATAKLEAPFSGSTETRPRQLTNRSSLTPRTSTLGRGSRSCSARSGSASPPRWRSSATVPRSPEITRDHPRSPER